MLNIFTYFLNARAFENAVATGSVLAVTILFKTFKTILMGIADSITNNTVKMIHKKIETIYGNDDKCPNCGFNYNDKDQNNDQNNDNSQSVLIGSSSDQSDNEY